MTLGVAGGSPGGVAAAAGAAALDAAADVTVHHLLCHTSRIADYAEEERPDPATTPNCGGPALLPIRAAGRLPAALRRPPPYRPPGGGFQYSNAGYIVLGLVIEEVSGLSYVEAVQAEVFEPAGMAASGFFRLGRAGARHGARYCRPAGPWRTNIYSIPVVGGGGRRRPGTAADLDRFLRAYDDGSLLGDRRDAC